MLNSIGLQGPGIEAFVASHLPRLGSSRRPTSGSPWADSRRLTSLWLRAARRGPSVAAIELNLSCPNVDEAPETAARARRRRARRDEKPLYAKLSPAQWDVAARARAVVDAGADGLSLVNTIRGLALDPRTLRPRLAPGRGGTRATP